MEAANGFMQAFDEIVDARKLELSRLSSVVAPDDPIDDEIDDETDEDAADEADPGPLSNKKECRVKTKETMGPEVPCRIKIGKSSMRFEPFFQKVRAFLKDRIEPVRVEKNSVSIIDEDEPKEEEGAVLTSTEPDVAPNPNPKTFGELSADDKARIRHKYNTSMYLESIRAAEWAVADRLNKFRAKAAMSLPYDETKVMTPDQYTEFVRLRVGKEDERTLKLVYVRNAYTMSATRKTGRPQQGIEEVCVKFPGVSGSYGAPQDRCWMPAIVVQAMDFPTTKDKPNSSGFNVLVFSRNSEDPICCYVRNSNDIRFIVDECKALVAGDSALDPDTMALLPLVGADLVPTYEVLDSLRILSEGGDATALCQYEMLARTLHRIRGPKKPTVGDLALFIAMYMTDIDEWGRRDVKQFLEDIAVISSVINELTGENMPAAMEKWNIMTRLA